MEIFMDIVEVKSQIINYCRSRGCRGDNGAPDCKMFHLSCPCVQWETDDEDLIYNEYKTLFGRDPRVKTPEDICAGDLIMCRNSSDCKCVFVATVFPVQEGRLCAVSRDNSRYVLLDKFNDQFQTTIDSDIWEITKVYGPAPMCRALDNSVEGRYVLYSKPVARKMTVKEISEELGYPVEVI